MRGRPLGVIVVVGAVFFVLVQRRKPSHLQAPESKRSRRRWNPA